MAIYLRSLSGRVDTVPVQGDGTFLYGVTWSPDGTALAALTSDSERRYTLRFVSLRGRAGRVLLEDSVLISPVAWNGEAGAIYYIRTTGSSTMSQLWKLPVAATGVPTGRPTMVLPMLDGHSSSVADDGALAYTRVTRTVNLWEAALAGDTARRWLARGTAEAPFATYSPDGRSVAFVRSEGATANLWLARSDSGAPEQLTFLEEGYVASASWSPDARRIAFCEKGEAPPRLGVVSLAGRGVTRPTTALSISETCAVAWVSGDEILYQRPGNRNFAVLSLSGRPARHLVANDSVGWMFFPQTDPTGRLIAVAWNRRRSGGAGLWLISLADSSQRLLRAGDAYPTRWATNGEALYTRERDGSLLRVPVAAPDSATPVPLPPGCPSVLDISPGGTRVLCYEATVTSDIWLIRNFDPTWPVRTAPPPRRR